MGASSLAETHPELAAEWHSELNGSLTPEQVSAGSHQKVWWLGACSHQWQTIVKSRALNKRGCPYCAGTLVLAGFNDLATTHPELAAEWHSELNGDLTPTKVNAGSGKKIWWRGACSHAWRAVVSSRTLNKRGCPYCAGTLVLAGFNDLATTHPELAAEWHSELNGDLTPTKVNAGSHQKVWWKGTCSHQWRAEIKSRALNQRGCPSCSFGGFTTTNPGIIYFIHNRKHNAFKVGITNQGIKTDRLAGFVSKGWRIVKTWEHHSGLVILETETRYFRWLRKELQVPTMLTKFEMGARAGASETFSDAYLSESQVIEKLEQLLAELQD